jgi:hypothetical protein
MRDGTVLYADIYRPVAEGTYPVLLIRLPYNKAFAQSFVYGPPEWYAAQCYIVVSQDVRGQFASQGTFYPFRNEMNDGYDSVEWAAQLPGSTGKVGMYGFSYVGATQWLAAVQAPPHLTAIVPAHTSSDYYEGWFYEGGAFSLAFAESWPLSGLVNSAIWRLGEQQVVDQLNKGKDQLPTVYAYLPIGRLPWLVPQQPEIAGYFLTGSSMTPGTTIGSNGVFATVGARSPSRRSTSAAGMTCSLPAPSKTSPACARMEAPKLRATASNS